MVLAPQGGQGPHPSLQLIPSGHCRECAQAHSSWHLLLLWANGRREERCPSEEGAMMFLVALLARPSGRLPPLAIRPVAGHSAKRLVPLPEELSLEDLGL